MQHQDASKEPKLTRREMLEQWKQNRIKSEPPKNPKPVFVKPVKFEEILRTPQKFPEKPKVVPSSKEKQSITKPPSSSFSIRKLFNQQDAGRIKERDDSQRSDRGNVNTRPSIENSNRPNKCLGVQSCVQKFSVPTHYIDKGHNQAVRDGDITKEIVNQMSHNAKPKGIVSVGRTIGWSQEVDKLAEDFVKSAKECSLMDNEIKASPVLQVEAEKTSIMEGQPSILQECLDELSSSLLPNESEHESIIKEELERANNNCEQKNNLVSEENAEEAKIESNATAFQVQTIDLDFDIVEDERQMEIEIEIELKTDQEEDGEEEEEQKQEKEMEQKHIVNHNTEIAKKSNEEEKKTREQESEEELDLIVQIIEEEESSPEVSRIKKKASTAKKRTCSERDKIIGSKSNFDQIDNLKKVFLKSITEEDDLMTPKENLKPEFLPIKQNDSSKAKCLVTSSNEPVEGDNYGSVITYSVFPGKDEKVVQQVRRSKRVSGVVRDYSQTTARKSVKKSRLFKEETNFINSPIKFAEECRNVIYNPGIHERVFGSTDDESLRINERTRKRYNSHSKSTSKVYVVI